MKTRILTTILALLAIATTAQAQNSEGKYKVTIERTPDDYDYSFVMPSLWPDAEGDYYAPGTTIRVNIPDPNAGSTTNLPGAYFQYLIVNGVNVDVMTDNSMIIGRKIYQFTMPEEDVNILVGYELRDIFKITKSCEPAEGGAISGTNYVKQFQTVTLTATPNKGYVFKEWRVSGSVKLLSETNNPEGSFRPSGSSLIGFSSVQAVFEDVALNLLDNDEGEEFDNQARISDNQNGEAIVRLRGRTFYKTGNWNTICLPFALADFSGTPLEDATVKELASSSYNASTQTLTLNFSTVSEIEAGKPYIVKWASGENIENPVFENVVIGSATASSAETDFIDFVGCYSIESLTAQDRTVLYMGGDSKLYYPGSDMKVNAFRGFFRLKDGLTAGDLPNSAKAIVLDFGDETTSLNEELRMKSEESVGEWYSIDGRKLSGEPTAKGVYIYKGKKVIIK